MRKDATMDSVDKKTGRSSMTRIKCPPFCKPDCNQKHHDLLLAILNVPPENKGSKRNDNGGLDEFESCIQSYLKKGWQKNHVVPDALAGYQFPLVHWASVLGKTKALEWLIKHGFDPTVRAPTSKETALHRCFLCLELSEMFLQRKVLERKVEAVVELLKSCLVLRNRGMDTPLHVAARQLVEGRRKDHFEDCIKILLAKLKQHFPDQFTDVMNAQNSEGDTIVHILAGSEEAFLALRIVINEGAVTSTMNTHGKTPLDIATEKGSIRATAMLKRIADEKMSNQVDDADKDKVAIETSNDREKEEPDKASNDSSEMPSNPVCSCKVKKECSDNLDILHDDSNNDTFNLDQNNNLLGVLRAVGLWSNVKELALKKRNEEEKLLASKLEELQATNEAIEDAETVVDETRRGITLKEKELERIQKELNKMKKDLTYMNNEQQELNRKRGLLNNECGQLEKKRRYCDSLLKVHEPQEENKDS